MDFLIENHNLYTRNQSKLQLLEKILPVYVLRENEIKQDFWHKNCKILLVEHSPLEFQAKNLGKNTASCNFEVWTENQLETNLPKFLTAHSCSFIKNSQTTFKKTSTDGSNTDTETCSLYPVHPKFTNFIRYKSISSTMDQPNIKSGQVVIADVQTSGKGRKNNSWISPLGACYFTFYLDLPKNFAIEYLSLTQLIAATAIVQVIDSPRVRSKWPNDIYVDGQHKVGGILTKSSCCGSNFTVQFGIGLNTRLENHTGLNPTLHSLGIGHFQTPEDNLQIIHQITQKIEFHIQNFNLLQFKAEYTQFWLHESQIIKIHNVENSDQEYQIVGIDNSGYLLAKNLKTGKNYSVDPAENRFDMMNGLILQK